MRIELPMRPLIVTLLCAIATLPAPGQQPPASRYTLSLSKAAQHLIGLTLEISPGPDTRLLQLPVWNALYQVRDFSQYLNWIKANGMDGRALPVIKVDKSQWRVSGASQGARIEYEIYADVAGPYSAQLNDHHAFLNMADVLLYAADLRLSPMAVRFTAVPTDWKIATSLPECGRMSFCARNYDHLVDSPFEVGTFREQQFDDQGVRYRVVVDADPGDYEMNEVVAPLRSIVRETVRWMGDRPFESYVFFYHFPQGPGGGGMEHAESTAIEISAVTLKDSAEWFQDVSAHEFFHAWNVKRIRPQSLEPVDYTKENYTRALWFSEGVTSTVAERILLQAGLLSESRYLEKLGEQITILQRRGAHRTQSAEESSLDAWLEKYTYYRQPDRSISYYNKGELLGVLLDLTLRQASRGEVSLRELFRRMNDEYPRKGRFFDDSDGVREAAEEVCRCELRGFFDRFVAGTDEIPWNDFFSAVGLRVVPSTLELADPGIEVQRVFGGAILITQVDERGPAAQSGLAAGDTLLEINGRPAGAYAQQTLEALRAADTVKLRVRRGSDVREVKFKLGSKQQVEYVIRDVENVTPEQKARRGEWLRGETRGSPHP